MLTARLLNWPNAKETVHKLATTSSAEGVRLLADMIEKPPVATNVSKFSGPEKKAFSDGQTIFQTLCATCHGADGRGLPMLGAAPGARLAPALAGSKTINGPKDGPILVLLHGLSGDIEGKKYEGQMIPMNTFDDTWIASVISYVRNSFGNRGGFVLPAEVKQLRAATVARTQPWTEAELRAVLPHPLTNRKEWKLNASHNAAAVAQAVDGDPATRYDTKAPMSAGMWFTIELPAETEICGLQLDYAKSANDFPRGYTVELSGDGETWAPPVAKGVGANGSTSVDFPPAKAKWIRITQTGKMPGTFWSIHELQVLAPGAAGK
jgi:mono/diheme cytochrome c family protein